MSDDRIEGFMVGGTTSITVANEGHAIVLCLSNRALERPTQVTLSDGQSKRLRRLLGAAERRAK